MSKSKIEKAQNSLEIYMKDYPEGIIHGIGRSVKQKCINVYGTTEEVLKRVPDTIDGFPVKKLVRDQAVLQR